MFHDNLDWTVEKRNLQLATSGTPVPDFKALVRQDNGAQLAIVGKDYEVVQNGSMLGFMKTACESGLLVPTRTGSHKKGRICSADYLVPGGKGRGEARKGDIISAGVRASWGHGGKGITVRPYFLRLVCTNGMTSAVHGRVFKLSHRVNVHDRLVKFEKILEQTIHDFEKSMRVYSRMAQTQITGKDFEEYVKRTYNLKEMQEVGAELAARSQAPDMDEVMADLLAGHRDQVDGEERRIVVEDMLRLPKNFGEIEYAYRGAPGADPGTVWGAYNAITYHVDHQAGRSAESRQFSADFGQGAQLRTRAFQEAVKLL